MTDEQIKELYVRVLEIAAYSARFTAKGAGFRAIFES